MEQIGRAIVRSGVPPLRAIQPALILMHHETNAMAQGLPNISL